MLSSKTFALMFICKISKVEIKKEIDVRLVQKRDSTFVCYNLLKFQTSAMDNC